MDVRVGYLCDGDIPGLAHFLEHMLVINIFNTIYINEITLKFENVLYWQKVWWLSLKAERLCGTT